MTSRCVQPSQCGFCFLNGAALAARTAVRKHHVERVLILDWDVHHGNGTQEIFESDPNVLYVSIHRLGPHFFPGTGEPSEVGVGPGTGTTVNRSMSSALRDKTPACDGPQQHSPFVGLHPMGW